mgnify:CR=1 FL=1
MKVVKFQKGEDSKVTRKIISKFGESIYHYPEVKSVFIKVCFKDGSNIGFRRDEEEDTFNEIMKEEYQEYQDEEDSI